MKIVKAENTLIIRLEIGDELVSCLTRACAENGVKCGVINGIGACDYAKIGCFSPKTKEYKELEFRGDLEICSLLGNITEKDGEPYMHLHITLGREDASVVGGHLQEALISVTGEIFVRKLPTRIGRIPCPQTGINVFDI